MNKTVKRITLDAMMLALLCLVGMFSIAIGDNIKVSLQFMMVIIIYGLIDRFLDKVLITSLYLIIGLFIPVYAGFSAGISPTFGFVIGFVLCAPAFQLCDFIKINDSMIKFYIASFASLIIVYIVGSIFLSCYLQMNYFSSLMVSVVPYIPFDILKIVVASIVVKRLRIFVDTRK